MKNAEPLRKALTGIGSFSAFIAFYAMYCYVKINPDIERFAGSKGTDCVWSKV
jgi:hypothetical protein